MGMMGGKGKGKGAPSPAPPSKEGTCKSNFPFRGQDSSERLLLREGLIDAIPEDLCGQPETSKNVILVIGDGMGWEMIRAGAIAKLVLQELEDMGCDTKTGCADSDTGDAVMNAFAGRTLSDYYTEGTYASEKSALVDGTLRTASLFHLWVSHPCLAFLSFNQQAKARACRSRTFPAMR